MKLPNARRALVDKEKITEYLLSTTSPRGRTKARFFLRFGFEAKRWREFADALRALGAAYEVVRAVETVHGFRYYVEGAIRTPDGRDPRGDRLASRSGPTTQDSLRHTLAGGRDSVQRTRASRANCRRCRDDKEDLQPGDVGTIVHIHPGDQAFVAEFLALDGETVAIATVLRSQARPVTSADLTHARPIETGRVKDKPALQERPTGEGLSWLTFDRPAPNQSCSWASAE